MISQGDTHALIILTEFKSFALLQYLLHQDKFCGQLRGPIPHVQQCGEWGIGSDDFEETYLAAAFAGKGNIILVHGRLGVRSRWLHRTAEIWAGQNPRAVASRGTMRRLRRHGAVEDRKR